MILGQMWIKSATIIIINYRVAFLSGTLDSSLTKYMMSNHNQSLSIKCYTQQVSNALISTFIVKKLGEKPIKA